MNHLLLEAVLSGRVPSVNVASPVGRSSLAAPPADAETTEIGDRRDSTAGSHEVREGSGRTEHWVHDPPAYLPTVIEMTVFMDIGARFEVVLETLDLNAENAITGTRRPPASAPSSRAPRSQESST